MLTWSRSYDWMKGYPNQTILNLLFRDLQVDARLYLKGSIFSSLSFLNCHPCVGPALSWPPWLTTPAPPSLGITAHCALASLPPSFPIAFIRSLPLQWSVFLCHQVLFSFQWKKSYTQVSFCSTFKTQVLFNIFLSQSSK